MLGRFRALGKIIHPFEVKNGEIAVPAGHGLGVEIDEAKLRELLVKDV